MTPYGVVNKNLCFKLAASIFRVENEDTGSKFFQNVGTHLPNYAGSHVRKP
jgi:hypothetical protein